MFLLNQYPEIKNRISRFTLFLLIASCFSLIRAQTPIPMGGQISTYTGAVRGYYFVAPVDFTVCQLYVEDDINTQMQHVEMVRLTVTPPVYPSVTNSFTSLFYQNNWAPNTPIPCNVQVFAGDIIGVYGARGNSTTMYNSYGPSPWTASVYGNNFDMLYSGMQFPLNNQQMHDIWYANFNRTGRVTMYYDCLVLDEESVDFAALPAGSDALVTWSVPTLMGCRSFDLERSVNGQEFELIHSADFKANGEEMSEFRFMDRRTGGKDCFYRLKMIKMDGSESYTHIEAVRFNAPASFDIYPNPMQAGDGFRLRFPNDNDAPLQIEVLDIQGKVVHRQIGLEGNDNIVWPGDLSPGVYMVRMTMGSESETKKLIVR